MPENQALAYRGKGMSYGTLAECVNEAAQAMLGLGLARHDRVAVYLEKRPETVAALFGVAAAGGVFVPVNPVLKATQVTYILKDCNVRILVTSSDRLNLLAESLKECEDLRAVIVVGSLDDAVRPPGVSIVTWEDLTATRAAVRAHRIIDTDMAAILYTSGSTGKPKGVVLSHRNMVAGARSVAQYLENRKEDRILSALPLSFDAGFSQLTTAFHVGASVTLINYLLPRDIITAVEREEITGLTAVPPLWIQLAQLEWPQAARDSLRYIANTGGRMPKATLDALRSSIAVPTRSAKRFRTPKCWWCARMARPARQASRANSCIVARWCRSATGTIRRRRRSASSPPPASPRAWSCRRSRSGRATPCARTKRDFCISSAAATR